MRSGERSRTTRSASTASGHADASGRRHAAYTSAGPGQPRTSKPSCSNQNPRVSIASRLEATISTDAPSRPAPPIAVSLRDGESRVHPGLVVVGDVADQDVDARVEVDGHRLVLAGGEHVCPAEGSRLQGHAALHRALAGAEIGPDHQQVVDLEPG